MISRRRIGHFARKPLPDKWMALKATIKETGLGRYRFHTRLRRALAHTKAEGINFASGLGNSANLLYGLVRAMRPETCVEIGSARGKSACYVGMALRENGCGKLYAIDPHRQTDWNDRDSVETFAVFCRNISALGLSEQVAVLRMTSEEAARDWHRPIDFLFIDGDHTYEGVRHDWELFIPHVKPFGIVAFHDTMWELPPYCDRAYARTDMGVPRFVDELRRRGYPALTIDKDFGFTLVQTIVGGCPLRSDLATAARRDLP